MFINTNEYSLDLKILIITSKKNSKMWSKAKSQVFKNDWFSSHNVKTKVTIWILDHLKIKRGITFNTSNFCIWFDYLIKIAARNNLKPTIH